MPMHIIRHGRGVKNHSDELIFHSQGLRRSAANLVIASENSPSRMIKAVLLCGLIGMLVIACAKPSGREASPAGISVSAAIESAADSNTALSTRAVDNLVPEDQRFTITTNYQPAAFSLGKLNDSYRGKHFTYQQLTDIAQKLGIPDSIEIDVSVGDPYTWEAAGIDIAEVSFYEGNTFVAGAECEVNTSNLARSIYKYEY